MEFEGLNLKNVKTFPAASRPTLSWQCLVVMINEDGAGNLVSFCHESVK